MFDPFDEMRRMQDDMDRVFKKTAKMADFGRIREPAIDMLNRPKEIVVIAELPGVEKDEIDVDVKPSLITITAESKRNRKNEREGYYYKERSSSSFKRTLTLPEEVVPEHTEADFKNGILEVTMPKKHFIMQAHKGKKIKIN